MEPFSQPWYEKSRVCYFRVESSQAATMSQIFLRHPVFLLIRIFSVLHFSNQWFYNIFQFSVGTLLLLSGTTQGLRRHAHTVRLLLTHGELASLILFPTELGPDNCQENKHELLEIKAFSYVFESVFERRFKKVSVRPSTCYETQVLNVDLLHAASTSRAPSSRHKWSALPASLLQNVRVHCGVK